MDDDTMTPRDRINDRMLRQMLDGAGSSANDRYTPSPTVRPHTSEAPHTTWGLENYPLASVYAPLQVFRNLYDRDTALMKGTVFTELDLPFMGETVTKGGTCRG